MSVVSSLSNNANTISALADAGSRGKPRRRSRRPRQPVEPSAKTSKVIWKSRRMPAYDLLDEQSLSAIETQADWLMDKVGVEFRGDSTALELFRAAGADVKGERVRFEPGHLRQLCAYAPAEFTLHSRNPTHTVKLGGNSVVLMPGYGSPFVTDLDQGRRYATYDDFNNFVKLTYITPYLHHSGGTVCEPTDIPVNKRHLDMVYSHLTLSDKPFMGGVTSPARAQDSIAMAEIVFGKYFLQKNTVMQANINVNSPFIYDQAMSGSLRVYAQANQCVCVSPAIFGGAMGPVTPAAMTAQTLAEAMVGIALVQLVRQGCPVVMGSFHSTMNLRTGSLNFSTPEANLVTMALSQLGRRLDVPTRSGTGGQVTAANVVDGQAMQDSANGMWATLLSGTHQVWHAAGWLEGGLTMSYEKFILDVDNCGAMMKMCQGMSVDESAFTKDSYFEINPGENFLATRHTLDNFADAFYESLLSDAGSYENWLEKGSMTAVQRANGTWKAMLAAYEQPTIDKDIDEALKAFVVDKKASIPDEWY